MLPSFIYYCYFIFSFLDNLSAIIVNIAPLKEICDFLTERCTPAFKPRGQNWTPRETAAYN